jgi:hypothetical protein
MVAETDSASSDWSEEEKEESDAASYFSSKDEFKLAVKVWEPWQAVVASLGVSDTTISLFQAKVVRGVFVAAAVLCILRTFRCRIGARQYLPASHPFHLFRNNRSPECFAFVLPCFIRLFFFFFCTFTVSSFVQFVLCLPSIVGGLEPPVIQLNDEQLEVLSALRTEEGFWEMDAVLDDVINTNTFETPWFRRSVFFIKCLFDAFSTVLRF